MPLYQPRHSPAIPPRHLAPRPFRLISPCHISVGSLRHLASSVTQLLYSFGRFYTSFNSTCWCALASAKMSASISRSSILCTQRFKCKRHTPPHTLQTGRALKLLVIVTPGCTRMFGLVVFCEASRLLTRQLLSVHDGGEARPGRSSATHSRFAL